MAQTVTVTATSNTSATVTAPDVYLRDEAGDILISEADASLTTGVFNFAKLTVTATNNPTVEVQ